MHAQKRQQSGLSAAQAKQDAATQREQVRMLTEQVQKADRAQRDHSEAMEARIRDLKGAVEEAQVMSHTRPVMAVLLAAKQMPVQLNPQQEH